MKRIQRKQVIVLKSSKSGENHRLVTLFTEDSQLIRALAFGASGSRSAMRALTNPFCLCMAELYHDPVKDLWRVTHMDGENLYDGVRADLKKFYTVSLISEIILKSFGGGDDRIFFLFEKTVRLIDEAKEDGEREILLVLYLWRYLRMNGVIADPGECSHCGRDILIGESIFYKGDIFFLCSDCRDNSYQELKPQSLEYLFNTSSMTYEEALTVKVDNSILVSLKKCFILLSQALVEYPLKTLKSGQPFI